MKIDLAEFGLKQEYAEDRERRRTQIKAKNCQPQLAGIMALKRTLLLLLLLFIFSIGGVGAGKQTR